MTRVALVAALAAAVVPPAWATDVSSARLRGLAARAGRDPAALAELRRVESVDGRPVRIDRILATGSRVVLASRLRTLAAGGAPAAPPRAQAAREQAARILSERRFKPAAGPPRPFRRFLDWLGDRIRPVGEAIDRAFTWIADRLPGGSGTLWTIIGAAVAGIAALLAVRTGRRRAGRSLDRAAASRGRAVDPGTLEREAAEAERRGDYERAVRLLFRAGLLRLGRARVIAFQESLTSGDVARRLRSADFDRLAATFDRVAYGGRAARPTDVEESRRAWQAVRAEVGA